jgi:hypothetical protein
MVAAYRCLAALESALKSNLPTVEDSSLLRWGTTPCHGRRSSRFESVPTKRGKYGRQVLRKWVMKIYTESEIIACRADDLRCEAPALNSPERKLGVEVTNQ